MHRLSRIINHFHDKPDLEQIRKLNVSHDRIAAEGERIYGVMVGSNPYEWTKVSLSVKTKTKFEQQNSVYVLSLFCFVFC